MLPLSAAIEFLDPSGFLALFGVRSPSAALRLATGILLAQAAAVSGLVALTIALRSWRKYAAKVDARRSVRVEKIVLGVMTTHMDAPGRPIPLPRLESRDRARFRRHLLANVVSIAGREQELLVGLYTHLGLREDDLRNLRSPFWWKRLEGISALEALGTPDGVEPLRVLLDDGHPLVALMALRVVALLARDEASFGMVLERVGKGAVPRHDVALEVLLTVGRKRPELLRAFATRDESNNARALSLRAIGLSRDPEAVGVLVGALSSPREGEVRAALEALEALARASVVDAGDAIAAYRERHAPVGGAA